MMDTTDKFIIEHNRSMTQQEIADRMGMSKSTISRRMTALRKSGAISEGVTGQESAQARERLNRCAMSRSERLEALVELRDRLHDDLGESGGASLARLSSEYRRTLEEIESLSTELDLVTGEVKSLNPVQMARLRTRVARRLDGVCDCDVIGEVLGAVFECLAEMNVLNCTPLAAILGAAESEAALED